LMGARGKTFEPMLHNTVNVTSVCGGEQALGIPSEFVIKLAVSLLPGYGSADMIAELRQIIGKEVELEVMGEHEAGLNEPDMGLFGVLTGIIREADPDGTPVPLLMPSPTDGRTFDRLGIQTYGFLPMNLPADFSFSQTIHAADERVPVNALDFGTDAIFKALQRFESK
jgi:acetylornithine deacetylase/succinyl-diaminopimelate desuccinylase-like protein